MAFVGVLAGSVGLSACSPEPPEPPQRCAPVSFESVELVYQPEPALVLAATLSPPLLSLELKPVQYVQQPAYWELNVVGCGPARAARPDEQPVGYKNITFAISNSLGTKGVAVVGADGQRQLIDVRWDPPPPTTTTTRPATARLYDAGTRPVMNYAAVAGGPLVPQRSGIAIEFKAGGTVEVRGCHISIGRWRGDGTSLSIIDLDLGEPRKNPIDGVEVCPGAAAKTEEIHVLDALRRVTSYRIVATYQFHTWYAVPVEHLVLFDAEGRAVLTGGVYTR